MTEDVQPQQVLLVLAGPCPVSRGNQLPHTFRHGDMAELVAFGQPDHGLTVILGRCVHCTVPLVLVGALCGNDEPDGPMYEARGAEL